MNQMHDWFLASVSTSIIAGLEENSSTDIFLKIPYNNNEAYFS